MRKVGGLYFFKLGLFGGSIYLNKPAMVEAGQSVLLMTYAFIGGYYGTHLAATLATIGA